MTVISTGRHSRPQRLRHECNAFDTRFTTCSGSGLECDASRANCPSIVSRALPSVYILRPRDLHGRATFARTLNRATKRRKNPSNKLRLRTLPRCSRGSTRLAPRPPPDVYLSLRVADSRDSARDATSAVTKKQSSARISRASSLHERAFISDRAS